MWLADPDIAKIVVTALRFGAQEGKYDLYAYVVMPNHVHILITPNIDLPEIMRWLKGRTARVANRILGRSGEPFWQDESYDHVIRSLTEFENTREYIEANPVRSGYVDLPQQYPWSSAYVVPQATKNDGLCHEYVHGD